MWSRQSAIERCRSSATYVVRGTSFRALRVRGGREAGFFSSIDIFLPSRLTYFIGPSLKTIIFRWLM